MGNGEEKNNIQFFGPKWKKKQKTTNWWQFILETLFKKVYQDKCHPEEL